MNRQTVQEEQDIQALTILTVDDEPSSLALYSQILIPNGHRITEACSLREAFLACARQAFDVCVLDLNLPDSQGIQTLQRLVGGFPELAVVVVTAEYADKNGLEFISLGAQDYLVKGNYDAYILRKSLHYAVERKRITQELQRAREKLEERVRERTQELLQANLKLRDEISLHHKTEQSLRESEGQLSTVLQTVGEGITFSDETGHFYIFNRMMEQLTGYSIKEANEAPDFSRLIYPDPSDWQKASAGLVELMHRGSSREVESKIVTKSGQTKYVIISSSVVECSGKRMFLSAFRDITERTKAEEALQRAHQGLEHRVQERTKELACANEELVREMVVRRQAQQALQESESRYRLLAENVTDIVVLVDFDFNWCYVSPSVSSLLGYSSAEAQTKSVTQLCVPASLGSLRSIIEQERQMGKDLLRTRNVELELIRKDGTTVWTEITASVIYNSQGAPYRIVGVVRDISERKKAMQALINSLHEKETLLKEVHHRVKNNLQIISSLLSLQSQRIKDEALLDMFKESQSRVKSIAFIHEKLYRSPELSRIDFHEYVVNLARELFDSYKISISRVKINVAIEGVFLDADTAVLCGLIINELLVNALKYAFPGERSGTIGVGFSWSEGVCRLSVSDDGVGIPEGFDYLTAKSLGIQLIMNLSRQLDGAVELERRGGTYFGLTFPLAGK